MVKPNIFHEEAVENRPEKEHAAALECFLVDSDSDLDAARGRAAGIAVYAAHDRGAVDAAHATDLSLGRAVGEIPEHPQHLAHGLPALPGPAPAPAEPDASVQAAEQPSNP